MCLSSEMKSILSERKSRNINDDDGIEKSWAKIVQALSKNEENTIYYLENSCKDDIYWISEVFEDVSENLQSENFIQCLRKLDKKFPELDMTSDIDIAEDYIKEG